MVSRRMMIAGGAGAVVTAGLGYRIWDRGVFSGASGPAYEPWDHWQGRVIDGIKRPLNAAILAANPHDTQPWLFELNNETSITVYADRARNLGAFDPFRREMHLGLGAAIENLVHAANVHGYTPYVRPVAGRLTISPPDKPFIAAHITMDPGAPSRDPLYEAIPNRHTHRGRYLEKPVDPTVLAALTTGIADLGVRVAFFRDAKARQDLADMIVSATGRIADDDQMDAASARWIRTGRRDVEKYRDGITLEAAGISRTTIMLARLAPDLGADMQATTWQSNTRDTQVHAPVLGTILVKDRLDMAQSIAAGRAWQRMHLMATAMGLVGQPLNQPVEMIDRDAQLGHADIHQAPLVKLAKADGWQPTFVFRLGYAERPAPPSPRRPLDDVMKSSGLA